MAAERVHANEVVKGSEIGEDLLVTGGPNGSKPGRSGGSIRSVMAGLAAAPGRRRRASAASEAAARATSRDGSGAGQGGVPGGSRGSGGTGSGAGAGGGAGVLGRFSRGAVAAARNHTLEVLAIVLIGVGGAVYPPIWLIGVALALPSKKWDIRDKFFGITLQVVFLIVGTVLIIVFGGQRASISAYAYEAWLGAERLSRVLAVAGAAYLAWRLRRGRRHPKEPPWNVPHRIG